MRLQLIMLAVCLAASAARAQQFDGPLLDISGRKFDLGKMRTFDAVVISFRDSSCPISNKQLPELKALENLYAKKRVFFVFVHVSVRAEDLQTTIEKLRAANLRGPVLIDNQNLLAKRWGAKTTTETLVLNKALELKYRGALNDQFTLAVSKPKVGINYAAEAIDSIIKNNPVRVSTTTAEGCYISMRSDVEKTPNTTALPEFDFSRIQRTVERKCVQCHHGGAGIMRFENLRDVHDKCQTVLQTVQTGLMPPWYVDEGYGPWRNDMSIEKKERDYFLQWLDRGCVTSEQVAVKPIAIAKRKVDLVFQIPEEVEIPAQGLLPYKNFLVDTGLAEDKWIRSMTINPTDSSVVHHVRIHVIPESVIKNVKNWKSRYADLAVASFTWVPGYLPLSYPDDAGVRLPAHSSLYFGIHYSPNGKKTVDRTKVGFELHRSPPIHIVKSLRITDESFKIPAQSTNFKIEAAVKTTEPMTIIGVGPHMHFRGRSATIDVLAPNGKIRQIFKTSNYNFDWQLNYQFATPVKIEPGSTITCRGWFDNSSSNPLNPTPHLDVTYGMKLENEMLVCGLHWY